MTAQISSEMLRVRIESFYYEENKQINKTYD